MILMMKLHCTAISELVNGSVPGPDSVCPEFLKYGGRFITDAVKDILANTFDDESLSQILKDIWICPVWKGGNKTLPAEYRPIALSSHIIKTMERIIRKQMVEFLITMDYFTLPNMDLDLGAAPKHNYFTNINTSWTQSKMEATVKSCI